MLERPGKLVLCPAPSRDSRKRLPSASLTECCVSIAPVQPNTRPSLPSQCNARPPSVPMIARPLAVVDLAQGSKNLGLAFGPHGQRRGEILQAQQSGIADLAQQSAFRARRLLSLWRARQQACQRQRRGRHHKGQSGQRIQQLGLCARWRRDQAEPHRVAGQQVGRDGAEHGVDRRPVWQDTASARTSAGSPRSASSMPAQALLMAPARAWRRRRWRRRRWWCGCGCGVLPAPLLPRLPALPLPSPPQAFYRPTRPRVEYRRSGLASGRRVAPARRPSFRAASAPP